MPSILETIQQDIACPQCDYNLRGLRGDVVQCPECGIYCDAAKIITARWRGPWQNAPGYSLVVLPSMLFLFAMVPFCMALLAKPNSDSNGRAGVLVVAFLLLVPWILSLAKPLRNLGNRDGTRMILLGHMVLVLYMGSTFGAFAFLLIAGQQANPGYIICAGMFAGLFAAARYADRRVAEWCIRRHLRIAARV